MFLIMMLNGLIEMGKVDDVFWVMEFFMVIMWFFIVRN